MKKFSTYSRKLFPYATDNEVGEHHNIVTSEKLDMQHFEERFQQIDALLERLGIREKNNSRYSQIKNVIRGRSQNRQTDDDDFKEMMAITDLGILQGIVNTFGDSTVVPPNFERALFEDSLVAGEGCQHNPGRDFLFEHYVAAQFKGAGCTVVAGEPDWIANYHGYSFGIAAKRFRIKSLEKNIKKARDQIKTSGLPGLIAIDVSRDSPLNKGIEFKGTREEYISCIHDWIYKEIVPILDKNLRRWKIFGEEVHYIVIHHFGNFFEEHTDILTTVHHFTVYDIKFSREATIEELWYQYVLEKMIQSLHTSAPHANVIHTAPPQSTASGNHLRERIRS